MSETVSNATKSGPASKRLTELRNLPVVSISEGVELGGVNGFLIDYDKGVLAGFLLASRKPGGGVRVAPWAAVSSFGNFAITLTKTSEVRELASDAYLLALFEKDIPLLGANVCFEGDDKLVGFVKDVSVNVENGSLLLLTVTSDEGFTSPYRASVPFSSVVSVTKTRVTIRGDQRVAYRKEGILGRAEERGSFVPLVLEETRWRAMLDERVRETMEKVQRELKDRFFADHEQFYLANERDKLFKDVSETISKKIEGFFEQKFDETARAFKELLTETARGLTPVEKFEEALGALKAEQERHANSTVELIGRTFDTLKTAAENRASELREEAAQLAADTDARLKEGLESLARKIGAELDSKLDALRDSESAARVDSEKKLDTRVLSLNADVQEFERRFEKSIEELRDAMNEKLAAGAAGLRDEFTALMDELKAGIEAGLAGLKEDLEAGVSAAGGELAAAVRGFDAKMEAAREILESTRGELHAEFANMLEASAKQTSELLNSMREDIGDLAMNSVRHDELASRDEKFAADIESGMTAMRSAIDAALETLATARGELSAEITNRLTAAEEQSAGFRDSLRAEIEEFKAVAAKRDDLASLEEKLSAGLATAGSELAAEHEQTAERFNAARRYIDLKIDDLAARLPSVDPEAVRTEILDLIQTLAQREELNEVSEKVMRALDEALEKTARSLDDVTEKVARDMDSALEKSAAMAVEAAAAREELNEKFVGLSRALEALPDAGALDSLRETVIEEITGKIAAYARETEGRLGGLGELEADVRRLLELSEKETGRIEKLEERVDEVAAKHLEIQNSMEGVSLEDLKSFKKTVFEEVLARAGEFLVDADRRLAGFGEELKAGLENSAAAAARIEEAVSAAGASFEERLSEMAGRFAEADELRRFKEEFTARLDAKAGMLENGARGLAAEIDRRVKELSSRIGAAAGGPSADDIRQLIDGALGDWKQKIEARLAELVERRFAESAAGAYVAAAGAAPQETPDIAAIVESGIEKRIEELREEILEELADQAADAEAKQPPGFDADALRERMLDDVVEAVRDRGLIRLMFDPDRLAESAATFPQEATEEQAAAYIGSNVEKRMLGKRSQRDIYTEDNFCIVKRGEIIDAEVIRRARDYGMFIELSLDFQDSK